MHDYVTQTGNGFNLVTDMARRTAQTMEQAFQNFFFDAMNGKIHSLKDVLKSLLDFAKQIISKVGAQLVTNQILSFIQPGPTSAGALPKFAFGGVGDFGAGSMAMLHRREAVVPLPDGRSIPVTMKSMGNGSGGGGGGGGVTVNVNNYSNAKVEQPSLSQSADGRQTITMLIRQEVKAAFADGSMDKNMRRFGNTPQPIGR